MSTVSDRIFDALNTIGLPVAYRDSDVTQLPRLNYSLISNYSIRKSNTRHTQVPIYQVDYFSKYPVDVESDDLKVIADVLEKGGLITSDWQEVAMIDEELDTGVYHYYIEVR